MYLRITKISESKFRIENILNGKSTEYSKIENPEDFNGLYLVIGNRTNWNKYWGDIFTIMNSLEHIDQSMTLQF